MLSKGRIEMTTLTGTLAFMVLSYFAVRLALFLFAFYLDSSQIERHVRVWRPEEEVKWNSPRKVGK